MIGRLSIRGRIAFGAIGMMACLAVLAWLAFAGQPSQYAVARRCELELAALHGEELTRCMNELAELGSAGVPVLAAALFNDREETADAAFAALERELTQWKKLEADESSPLVDLLARELAKHAAVPRATRNRAAAEIATRILVWPVDRAAIDNARLVSDCENILNAVGRDPAARMASFSGEEEHGSLFDADIAAASHSEEPRIIVSPPRIIPESNVDENSPGSRSTPAQHEPPSVPCTLFSPVGLASIGLARYLSPSRLSDFSC